MLCEEVYKQPLILCATCRPFIKGRTLWLLGDSITQVRNFH